jgi:hypothetical protein
MKMLNVNISQSAVEIIRDAYTGNDGLYSAVVPTEKSATKILDLCDSLGLQVNKRTHKPTKSKYGGSKLRERDLTLVKTASENEKGLN